MIKFCSHCRKEDHNDSECWSTRMVSPTPTFTGLLPYATPPFKCAPMSDELRVALVKVGIRSGDIS